MILNDDIGLSTFEVLSESKESLPPGIIMRGKGPIGITEKENRNGRLYEDSFWNNVLSRPEVQSAISERAMVGCADHPTTFVPPFPTISHVMTKSWLDRDTHALMAEFEILDTPMGHIIETLFRSKIKLGASTRAVGRTELRNGKNLVCEKGYRWGGFDFVFEPSAQNAYPSATQMKEVREEIEKLISETSATSLFGIAGDSADTKKLYESVLEKIGCGVSLLNEKFQELPQSPISKVESSLYAQSVYLESQNALLEQDITVSKQTSDQLQAKVSELETIVSDLSNKLKSATSELDQSKADLDKSKTELDKNKTEFSSQVEKLNTKITFLSQEFLSGKVNTSGTNQPTSSKPKTVSESVDRTTKPVVPQVSIPKQTKVTIDPAIQDRINHLSKERSSLLERASQMVINSKISSRNFESRLFEAQEQLSQRDLIIRALESDKVSLNKQISNLRVSFYGTKTGLSESDLRSKGILEMNLDEFNQNLQSLIPADTKVTSRPRNDFRILGSPISIESVLTESVDSPKKPVSSTSKNVAVIFNHLSKGRKL